MTIRVMKVEMGYGLEAKLKNLVCDFNLRLRTDTGMQHRRRPNRVLTLFAILPGLFCAVSVAPAVLQRATVWRQLKNLVCDFNLRLRTDTEMQHRRRSNRVLTLFAIYPFCSTPFRSSPRKFYNGLRFGDN